MNTRPVSAVSRRWPLLTTVASAVLIIAGCSSSTSSSGEHSSSGVNSTPGSDIVSRAKQIVAAAESGLVGSKTPADPLTKVALFNGPSEATAAPKNLKVVAVSGCVDPCQYTGSFAKKLGASLGWTYELKQSTDGSPQSFVQLTQSAIAEKPNVILFLGTPDLYVQQQIKEARAAGIKMVGVNASPLGAEKFDAYVETRQDITLRLLAYAAIAKSNGNAHVLWVTPSGFPDYVKNTALAKAIFEQCPGCKVTYANEQLANMFSPTATSSFVTAQLQADPKLDYVIYVDDFSQIGAAQQAAAGLSRNVMFLSGDGGTQGLGFVKKGIISADPGLALEWVGYAAYDDIRRVTVGLPPLGPDSWGGASHIWVKSNLPGSLAPDVVADKFNSFVDYRGAYQSLWSRAK